LVYARTQDAARALSAEFRLGQVQRIYWAIVSSPPPDKEGTLRHSLRTRPGKNKTYLATSGGKNAELRYRILSASERYWLLEIELVTGRHHQIRAQLSAVGSPIRGDLKYGAKRSIRGGGIGLHASRISLAHPLSGDRVSYFAPAPDDGLWNALTAGLGS
jgi:23S rRNA pseudouridine1911/1915/1917 synthase